MTSFEIESIELEGYKVDAPPGLAELLNAVGHWRVPSNHIEDNPNYKRKVVKKENGKLSTYLTYSEKSLSLSR